MKKPAATKASTHICKRTTGNTPHVGGPALNGSPNVFFQGQPALRKDDPLFCNAPDQPKVASGSSVVSINGRLAARAGDLSSHQSKLEGGSTIVFIGG